MRDGIHNDAGQLRLEQLDRGVRGAFRRRIDLHGDSVGVFPFGNRFELREQHAEFIVIERGRDDEDFVRAFAGVKPDGGQNRGDDLNDFREVNFVQIISSELNASFRLVLPAHFEVFGDFALKILRSGNDIFVQRRGGHDNRAERLEVRVQFRVDGPIRIDGVPSVRRDAERGVALGGLVELLERGGDRRVLVGRSVNDDRAFFRFGRNHYVRAYSCQQRNCERNRRMFDGVRFIRFFVRRRYELVDKFFDAVKVRVNPPRDNLIAHNARVRGDANGGEVRVQNLNEPIAAVSGFFRNRKETVLTERLRVLLAVFNRLDKFIEPIHLFLRAVRDDFESGRRGCDD